MEDWKVEKACASDIQAIARMQCLMALETEGMELDPETVLEGVTRSVEDPQVGLRLVARDCDGEPIGTLMVTKEWSDWHARWYWWIQSVYVKPELRRRGVWRSMYNWVLDAALLEDVPEVRLYVNSSNKDGIAAYEECDMKRSRYLIYESLV